MRLNKMKLAAAMMSAVMAASSMPVTAFAADFTDGGAGVEAQADFVDVVETPEVSVEAGTVEEAKYTAEFDAEKGTVKVYLNDVLVKTDNAIKKVVSEPDCTNKGTWAWYYEYEGRKFLDTDNIEPDDNKPALGHQMSDIQYETTAVATCTAAGSKIAFKKCTRVGCGHVVYIGAGGAEVTSKDDAEPLVIEQKDHKKGEKVVEYVAGTTDKDGNDIVPADESNVKITGDKVELINKNQDGYYTEIVTYVCSAGCNQTDPTPNKAWTTKTAMVLHGNVTEKSKRIILPLQGNKDYAETYNINNTYAATLLGKDPDKIDPNEILLADCTKPASYIYASYDEGDKEIAGTRKTVAVDAHHVYGYKEAVAKVSSEDVFLKEVVDKDTNEVVDIVSLSCKDIEYNWVDVCAACKKEVKTLKTAKGTGEHTFEPSVQATLKVAKAELESKGRLSKDTYEAFAELETAKKVTLKLEGTCDGEGTITVTSKCTECGKDGVSDAMKIEKLGHLYGAETKENEVKATCAKEGSFDIVQYCKVCNDKKEIRTVKVDKLPHSFVDAKDPSKIDESKAYVKFNGTVVVDTAGANLANKGDTFNPVGCFQNMFVTAVAAIDCTNCGKAVDVTEKFTTADTYAPTSIGVADGTLVMTIVDIEKESVSGTAGFITLEATFNKTVDKKTVKVTDKVTVPYFSNFAAYLERNPEAKNGLVRDDDGVFRYYIDGKFQEDYTGLVDFNGETFFVENGVDTYKDGVVRTGEKTFYFLSLGRVVKEHNGFAMYDGNWFIIKDGKVDLTANGLFKYNGGTFLFTTGGLRRDVTGLWLEESTGTWYYLHEGQVQDQFTGTTWYDGQQFELVNGKLVK